MPTNERGEAQRKRAEARQRRRTQSSEEPDDQVAAPSGDGDSTGEEPLAAVKQAAKVAAAGAAVGAAAAAARALSKHEDAEEEQTDQEVQAPRAEAPPEPDEAQAQAGEQEPEQEPQPQQPWAQREPEAQGRDDRPPGASPDEARDVVELAREQLESLLGRPPESVSAMERTHDGWLVTAEVVEVSRIPESTDVLASYEVELDEDRNLRRYARVRRYHRSQADQGEMA